jgi:putative MFS transporter
MRFKLPESPRWLVLHGKENEADTVVKDMERKAQSKLGGRPLPEPRFESVSSEMGKFPTRYLFRRPYSSRLALLVVMWFFWYIGNYGFLGDAPTLLSGHGITIAKSILFLAVGAAGYPIGAAIMIAVADKVERKFLIVSDTIVWLIGMILFGFVSSEISLIAGSFLASLALGMYLQVAYTFTAESYPTRARSSGFALSDGLGHIGGAVGALGLPLLVLAYNFQIGFLIIGITGLIAGLISLAGPSATKLRLEQISK